MPRTLIRIVLIAGLLAGPVAAAGADDVASAERLVRVRVTADVARIEPGRTFHVAVILDVEPHWHVYWMSSGETGAPTEISVRGPEGFTVGPVRYPRPRAFREPEGVTYGYGGRAVLFVPVTAPPRLEPAPVTFDVEVFFLVCRDRCLMGTVKRSLRLPAAGAPEAADPLSGAADPVPGAADPVPDPADRGLLDEHRRRLPTPLTELTGARARLERGRLIITGPLGGRGHVEFFGVDGPGITIGAAMTTVDGDRFRIEAPVTIEPRNAEGAPLVVRGLVALGKGPEGPCYDVALRPDRVPSRQEP